MIKLVKPLVEHKEKYIEMIKEWREYGGPYVPCIIDYDCNNTDEIDYESDLKFIYDYSNGNVNDDDIDYFESSDFYFIFDDEELVGMGEIRHNLKPLGVNTLGHIACGIRPSKRKNGYAYDATKSMIDKLKEDDIEEIVLCHYSENNISPKIISKLNFQYRNSIISSVSKKEIKCYTRKVNIE